MTELHRMPAPAAILLVSIFASSGAGLPVAGIPAYALSFLEGRGYVRRRHGDKSRVIQTPLGTRVVRALQAEAKRAAMKRRFARWEAA